VNPESEKWTKREIFRKNEMGVIQACQWFAGGGTTFATTGRGFGRCNIAITSSEIAR